MCQRISARRWVDGPHLLILHQLPTFYEQTTRSCRPCWWVSSDGKSCPGAGPELDVLPSSWASSKKAPGVPGWRKCCRYRCISNNRRSVVWLPMVMDRSEAHDLTLEQIFDQMEHGEWRTMCLIQFLSREDAEVEPMAASIDEYLVMSKFAMAMVKPLSRNRQGNSDSGWRSWLTAMSWPASNILKSMPCKICGQSISWPTWISCSAIKSWVWGRRMRTEALPPRLHLRWCSPMTIRSEKKPWNSWTTAWGCQQLWWRRERMCPWKNVSLWLQHPWTLSPACKTPKPGQGHPSQTASGTATHIL